MCKEEGKHIRSKVKVPDLILMVFPVIKYEIGFLLDLLGGF
jgi:hypothetical protein